MYTSLEKLDIAARANGQTVNLLIQTDHRSPLAIAENGPLSVIFAITRCLVARRIGRANQLEPFRVLYRLDVEPPTFFSFAINAAGAAVVVGPDQTVPSEQHPRIPELLTFIDDACMHLAESIRTREGLGISVSDLRAHENRVEVGDDEASYYGAIVTLGAFVAAVLRYKAPLARFQDAEGDVVPFALAPPGAADSHSLPVFGMAKRYIDALRSGNRDSSEAPSTLLGLMFGEIKSITI